MSEKPPIAKKKKGKKSKKQSGTSSPKTPKSHKSSENSSPKPEIESVPPLFLSTKICSMHKKELKLYSENKEELICEDCSSDPSYMRYPSKISKIEDAFRMRVTGLYNVLTNYIMPKRSQIETQKSNVESCINAVKLRKTEIERDMKGEFSAMNERLNFSYGTKQAVLHNDLKDLRLDLDRIEHIINIVESSARDQISFLQRSTDLKGLIDLSLSKPIRINMDITSSDLPKELNKVREVVGDFPAVRELIKVKDEIIWKILHEKPSDRDVNDAVQKELVEWARLAEKYTQELKRFQINCEYCGCPLSEETVNTNCAKNLRGENRGQIARLEGTGRHYFSDQPKVSYREKEENMPDKE